MIKYVIHILIKQCFSLVKNRSGKTVNIAILANPSHLESVDPLIVGRVRAEQVEKNDTAGIKH